MYENDAVATSPHDPQGPATGAGAEASTLGQNAGAAGPIELPMAIVVVVITRDRITQHAHLHLGGLHTAARDFHRNGTGSWKSRDPDFVSHDERIGIELAEFVDALDLPDRVADMLPRAPSNPNSEARQLAAAAAATLQDSGVGHAR